MNSYVRRVNENPFIQSRNEKREESRSGCFRERQRSLITQSIGAILVDRQYIGSGSDGNDMNASS
jgi:hypothetical protein